ncbi:MAG: hypothetical protein H8E62_08200 [Planctomycetes bacterium]|nr:hypothetical protein [Planctomycetota bacterium]
MKTRKSIIILIAFAILIIVGALITLNKTEVKTEMMTQYKELGINDISQEKWEQLAKKNIFFSHMSVGNNIMDGVEDILKQKPNLPLKTCRIENPETISNQGFCDSMLGSNANPLEKIASFQSQMQQLETPPDIAFLKFCYVDFYVSTDAQKVFNAYQKMVRELQTDFPDTIFMHCTVPLTSEPKALKRKIKETIKSFLGKTTTIDHNKKRLEFGDMLKKTYAAETIIDITLYESTTPEGNYSFKSKNGLHVPFMVKAYTYDGGHLNEAGRERVAEQVLIQLANVID